MDDGDNAQSVGIRPKFGNRFLVNENDVFQHNAWDNVEWDEVQENDAKDKVKANSEVVLSSVIAADYELNADKHWDVFYNVHSNHFFKDRHWLFTEFPELNFEGCMEKKVVCEIGCGVGNTIYPVLQCCENNNIFVYGCDFSKTAIEILKENKDYDTKRCEVFVLDATADDWKVPFQYNSLDIVILIFVLSSVHPDKYPHILKQIFKYLKPGGLVLFRDYGRYDLAQLRFKSGQCIAENFYVRGDKTRVYFFSKDEIETLFESVGFIKDTVHVDRRLQVNRGRLLKMYRIWIQAKYKKPV